MAFSTIICLKSVLNNKYLRFRNEDDQAHGLLQFAAEKALDPYAQFEVEMAKTSNEFVHIKSRYTNKYLVRWTPNQSWITASAYASNEDQKSWDCTLLKIVSLKGNDGNAKIFDEKIRIIHVQLGRYVSLVSKSAPFNSCLLAESSKPNPTSSDVFTAIEWYSVLKLPKSVVFKGDNDRYLGAYDCDSNPYLQFSYNDPLDEQVKHEVITCPNTLNIQDLSGLSSIRRDWDIRFRFSAVKQVVL